MASEKDNCSKQSRGILYRRWEKGSRNWSKQKLLRRVQDIVFRTRDAPQRSSGLWIMYSHLCGCRDS